MNHFLRRLFFSLVVRPFLALALGVNVRHRRRLPSRGPALVVANHNSHLDALVLMSLFPTRRLPMVRPVGAADYFFRNALLSWFSRTILGIIPLDRSGGKSRQEILAPVLDALAEDRIVIFFPEGTRGDPERAKPLKSGVAFLAETFPEVPVYPVFMHGLGKALPKGEALLVPFFCDVFVGEPFSWTGTKEGFMAELGERMARLAEEGKFPAWE